MFLWSVLAVFVLFFSWVAWASHKRDQSSSGPDVTSERHRKTGGYSSGA